MGSAVNVALPNIGMEFSLDAVMLSWITMAYLLASAVFLVPLGKIGDMWGRKKMFLLGNIFFGLATILCAVADTGITLIVGRLLQGIGSAMMFSTSMAIVISAFPASERGKIIGLNVSAVYVGLSVSPILGGVLTQTLGWRSLFVINAVVTLMIVLAIIFKIKAEWKENEHDKFDWLGTLVYIPSMTALMFGFSKLPNPLAIFFTLLGIVGLIIFVMMELKHPFPLLNMKLFFENRVFGSSNLSAFINYAATFAVSFILSLYLQYSKHLSPRDAGLILMTQPVLMAFTAIFSGRLSDKINPRILASSGMAICMVGMLLLSFIESDTSYIYLTSSLIILGFGFGLFSSPNTNLVMSSVKPNYYGIASATLSTMRSTGMMFSMAIATLSIHLFVGDNKINDLNIGSFINSSKVVFIIFTVLSFVGIFLSYISVKKVRASN